MGDPTTMAGWILATHQAYVGNGNKNGNANAIGMFPIALLDDCVTKTGCAKNSATWNLYRMETQQLGTHNTLTYYTRIHSN